MNKPRRDRIDGVLLLDKPGGLTSNHAMMAARRLLNAEKAGHGGTLDPMATGLLPLLFGEATKFAHDLLDADKTYLAELMLGVTTDSGDADGQVLQRQPVDCDEAAVRAAAGRFVGDLLQTPPMYSALKRDGKPLYAYARAGQTVERSARPVRIHALEVVGMDLPRVSFRVHCSKGTYIRTLAEDIGQALGCGAHLCGLRRERVGALTISAAIDLPQLEAQSLPARRAGLLAIDSLLHGLPRIDLADGPARRLCNGQRLRLAHDDLPSSLEGAIDAPDGLRVRVYSKDQLLGLASLTEGLLAPTRLISTDTSQ